MASSMSVYRLNLSDLASVLQCMEMDTSVEDPLEEEELVYMLGLPLGCKIHLVAYGKLAHDSEGIVLKVHIKVSCATQAAVDHITCQNPGMQSTGVQFHRKGTDADGHVTRELVENCVVMTMGKLKRHHAQMMLPAEQQERVKRQRREAKKRRTDAILERSNTNTDFVDQ